MVDYAIVIELAGDIVDDERHGELENSWSPLIMRSKVSCVYLNDDANQYESLVFTLGANTLPPYLEA